MSQKIWIIATGWNCESLAMACVTSVLNQDYDNFHLIVINDGSTDGTEKAISGMNCSKISAFHYKENKGAAYRRWQVMMNPEIKSEDVILLLGLDDELLPNALKTINAKYLSGVFMTYGNWKNQRGEHCSVPLDFPEQIHRHRLYRTVQYRSTAPNTFKKKLIEKLTPADLQVNGEWVQSCTETNLMFCCLEMCGKDRIGIIREPIYLYNESRSTGTIKRFGKAKQDILLNFQQRNPKPLI